MEVGQLCQRAIAIAGEDHHRDRQSLEDLGQAQQLLGAAGEGCRQDHVAGGNDSEIAVDGFGRMEKEGRRSG